MDDFNEKNINNNEDEAIQPEEMKAEDIEVIAPDLTQSENDSIIGDEDRDPHSYTYVPSDESSIYRYSYTDAGSEKQTEDPEPHKKKKGFRKRFAALGLCAALCLAIIGGVWYSGRNSADAGSGVSTVIPQTATIGSKSNASAEETSVVDSTGSTGTVNALDVSDVVEEVMPAMVSITSTVVYQNYYGGNGYFGNFGNSGGDTYEVDGAGSGFIIGQNDTELLILTNNHVVEDASSLMVTFINDTSIEATIKGTNSDSDLAVIAIPLENIDQDTLDQIKTVQLGSSDEMKLGQTVIAIGNALGYGQSVTVGVVSALERTIEVEGQEMTLMQTDAAINFGNSGGALLNASGEVIGINVAKTTTDSAEGMGYAIPISSAEEIINELMSMETRQEVSSDQSSYLGIQAASVTADVAEVYGMPEGLLIAAIVETSPAATSGLQVRDIVTKFGGVSVSTMDELSSLMKTYAAGETVTLTIERLQDGEYVEMEIDVTLGLKSDYQ